MIKKIVISSCIIAGCCINSAKACTITELSNNLLLNDKTYSISIKDIERGFPGIISTIKPKESFQWGFLKGFEKYNWMGKCEPITPAPVPEPSTMLLLGCGLIGLSMFSRRKLLKK